MGKLFGTDGIRGIAGEELTADLAYKTGLAVSKVLTEVSHGAKPRVVIGKDTRISGDMFESAVTAGLCALGTDTVQLGVVPTPAVAYIVKSSGADAGIMISASHNPSEYNGIKVFSGSGMKLSDELEDKIEAVILSDEPLEVKKGGDIGIRIGGASLVEEYEAHVRSLFTGLGNVVEKSMEKRRILVDLSNGSASATAKEIFNAETLGRWKCEFIAYDPDGMNINDNCGSTQMKALSEAVRERGFDLGIAFDGDADRCLAVDETGKVIDGDAIMALLGEDMKAQGKLPQDTIVVTMLSNLGLHIFAREHGMKLSVTGVGDRYVLEEMLRGGYSLGGEQSGHIIMTDYATTGDGQVTAARILTILAKYPGKKASELFTMRSLPQVSLNVKVPQELKKELPGHPAVMEKLAQAEEKLAGRGRVLLRPSGTEALIRIMLEGEDENALSELAHGIADVINGAVAGK